MTKIRKFFKHVVYNSITGSRVSSRDIRLCLLKQRFLPRSLRSVTKDEIYLNKDSF